MLKPFLSNIPVLLGECDFFDNANANTAFTKILGLARVLVRIIQIVVPIILIVLGTIDMSKAVIAGDEKQISDAKKPFMKRLVAAVIVFLVPLIVGIVMQLLGAEKWNNCWNSLGFILMKK